MKERFALGVLCVCLSGCFVPVYSGSDSDTSSDPIETIDSTGEEDVNDAPPEQY